MENKLDLVKLIQPDNAPTQVKQIYDEICWVKDPRWLGPLFGFFAISPPFAQGMVGAPKAIRAP